MWMSGLPSLSDLATHPAFSDDGLPLGDRPVVVAKWKGNRSACSLADSQWTHRRLFPPGDDRQWNGGPWSGRRSRRKIMGTWLV
jgi:hypothetical protein